MILSDILLSSEPLGWMVGHGANLICYIRADSTWRGKRAPWVPSSGFPPGHPGGLPNSVEAPRVVPPPRVVLAAAVPRVVLPPQRPVARQMPKAHQPNRPPTADEREEARLRTEAIIGGDRGGSSVEEERPAEERPSAGRPAEGRPSVEEGPAHESEEAERAARDALYALLCDSSAGANTSAGAKEAPSASRSGHQGGQKEEATKEAGSGGTKRCAEWEDELADDIEELFRTGPAKEELGGVLETEVRRALAQEESRKARKVEAKTEVLETTAKEEVPQGEEVLEATAKEVEVPTGEEVEVPTREEVEVKQELCDMIREVNTLCERMEGSSSSSSSGVRISYTIHVCYLAR